MRSFKADPYWAKPCLGYHVQARPNRATLSALADLQHTIAAASPVPLHLIPTAAMHVSVVTLISARADDRKKEAAWSKLSNSMVVELETMVREPLSISMTFRSLKFTSQAVIVSTDVQPAKFASLRSSFAALLDDLNLPASAYDQTHVTISRFAEDTQVQEHTIAAIEQSFVELSAEFDELLFVRERQYPSLLIDRL